MCYCLIISESLHAPQMHSQKRLRTQLAALEIRLSVGLRCVCDVFARLGGCLKILYCPEEHLKILSGSSRSANTLSPNRASYDLVGVFGSKALFGYFYIRDTLEGKILWRFRLEQNMKVNTS